MKKFLLLLLFVSGHVSSKEAETLTFTALCDNTDKLVSKIKEYKETPMIIGKAFDRANSTMTLWVNTKTGSWTLLSTKEKLSCIIGIGDNINVLPYKDVLQVKSSKMQ